MRRPISGSVPVRTTRNWWTCFESTALSPLGCSCRPAGVRRDSPYRPLPGRALLQRKRALLRCIAAAGRFDRPGRAAAIGRHPGRDDRPAVARRLALRDELVVEQQRTVLQRPGDVGSHRDRRIDRHRPGHGRPRDLQRHRPRVRCAIQHGLEVVDLARVGGGRRLRPLRQHAGAEREHERHSAKTTSELDTPRRPGGENFKLAAFVAGRARQLELGMCRDPLPDMAAHALVFAGDGPDIPTPVRSRLAQEATWVIELSQEEVAEARSRTTPR